MHRVCHCRRPHIGLESLPVHDINRSVEQTGDEILQFDIVIDAEMSIRVQVDHDVDVAVRPRLASGNRAEDRSMLHTLSLEFGLVLFQYGNDALAVYGSQDSMPRPLSPVRQSRRQTAATPASA